EALRATVSDFDARKLVGRSFDVFHHNPQHQRQLLAGLSKPFHSKVRIGGRHFDLNVSPVMGEDGQRLGAVVEWIDRTAQVEMDAR
ncbi:methyl-accepting chemotaxis protein, partial [Acinetobacter baumannii]